MRRQTSHGNDFSYASAASNHVLAASKTSLDLQQTVMVSAVRESPQGRATSLSPWGKFLQAKRHSYSMEELSRQWAAMTQAPGAMHSRERGVAARVDGLGRGPGG